MSFAYVHTCHRITCQHAKNTCQHAAPFPDATGSYWSYSELSKYVQYPGQAHMDAALHVLRYLRGTYDQAILDQHVDTLADTLCLTLRVDYKGWDYVVIS